MQIHPQTAVIVPAYNAAASIVETLDSVWQQTLAPDEIVVIDDGSTDGTAELIARMYASVRVIRQENAGQGMARQRGVEVTKADNLLFLDADDCLQPSALEKLAAALGEAPQAALAYARGERWLPTGEEPTQVTASLPEPVNQTAWAALTHHNFIRTPGCVLMRRAALNAAGGWDTDPRLKGNEDWDLWLRLSENAEFVLVPENLLKYRVHVGGFSGNRRRMYDSLYAMFDKHSRRWLHDPTKQATVRSGERGFRGYIAVELLREASLACKDGAWWKGAGLTVQAMSTQPGTTVRYVLRNGARRLAGPLLPTA